MGHPQERFYPYKIIELVELCRGNVNEAAVAMKCHTATVQKAIRMEEATRRLETAARDGIERKQEEIQAKAERSEAASDRLDAIQAGTSLVMSAEVMVLDRPQMLITIPPHKLEAFHRVAAVMGIEAVAL